MITWHVSEPEDAAPSRIEVETEQAGTYRAGVVIAHGHGGLVRVRYDDDNGEVWVDLPRCHYRWIA